MNDQAPPAYQPLQPGYQPAQQGYQPYNPPPIIIQQVQQQQQQQQQQQVIVRNGGPCSRTSVVGWVFCIICIPIFPFNLLFLLC